MRPSARRAWRVSGHAACYRGRFAVRSGVVGPVWREGSSAMNRVLALSLALATAAGALAGTGPRLPRWRFERGTDEWESRDTRVARSAQKAHEGGYSLQVDVDFPRPVSVFRRVNYHIDLIGRIVYRVYVPREAPDDVKEIGKEIDDTLKQIDSPAQESEPQESKPQEPKPDEPPTKPAG